MTQTVKWKTWVRFLDWEDPLEKGMATHSSILAWKIPMDREDDLDCPNTLERLGN